MTTTTKEKPTEVTISASEFRQSLTPRERGLLAGLLADDRTLRDTPQSAAQWRRHLSRYAASTRI